MKEFNYLFFWIDNFEFTIWNFEDNVYIENIVYNIDYDNTSFWYVEAFWVEFQYSKFLTSWYEYWLKFLTVIEWRIIDCFALLKWKKTKIMTSKNKVVFYSSFFILERLNKLPFTILEFMLCFWTPKLHRIDLALDVELHISEINKFFFDWVNFFSQIWIDKKNPNFSQTYYIWNPQSDRNRKFIFRIYDKILDSIKKKKSFLFPHLKDSQDVRRIELELRPEECSRFIWYDCYDFLSNKDNILERVFCNYFNKFSSFKIDFSQIKLTKYENIRFDLQSHYLKTWQIPKDYLSRSRWYLKNIKDNTGYQWVLELLFDDNPNNFNYYKDIKDFFDSFLKFMKDKNVSKNDINKILKKSWLKLK